MKEIIRFKTSDKEKSAAVFEIRRRVFVDEQHVSREEEYDEYEDESMHYMLLVDKTPAGTARWRFTVNGIKLERFAVLPEFRNNGNGSLLLATVLSDVLPHRRPVYLHAQVAAMNLYTRAGFKPEGDEFREANIPHYRMNYAPEH